MTTVKITPNQAAVNVYDHVQKVASGLYKPSLAVSKYIDQKTDNTFGRVLLPVLTALATGGTVVQSSYDVKSIKAMAGVFEKVSIKELSEIWKDPERSVAGKIIKSVGHFQKNTSNEALVAGALYFGKEAVITTGVVALIAATAPGAAVAAGFVAAGVGLKYAVSYFLASQAGHKFETAMADKITAGMRILTGCRRALKGEDKAPQQMHEIAMNLKEADKALGHGAHHESFGSTAKKDLTATVRVDKIPAAVVKSLSVIANDCLSLFKGVIERARDVNLAATLPGSKFAQQPTPEAAKIEAPSIKDNKTPAAKKSQPMKPGM